LLYYQHGFLPWLLPTCQNYLEKSSESLSSLGLSEPKAVLLPNRKPRHLMIWRWHIRLHYAAGAVVAFGFLKPDHGPIVEVQLTIEIATD